MNRPQENLEPELRFYDRAERNQRYSYDLTKQLAFYVISAELVFCGYILLNAQALGPVKYSSILFLMSGCAAILGLLWRFCYNETYHAAAHEAANSRIKIIYKLQVITYWGFVLLSTAFFIFLLVAGYKHISNIESKANNTPTPLAKQYNKKVEEKSPDIKDEALPVEKSTPTSTQKTENIKSQPKKQLNKQPNTDSGANAPPPVS